MKLVPLGVEPREGCCYWLEMGSHRLLLDCGLRDPRPLLDLPHPPDLVICSHAHPDHLRSLAAFHQHYPDVPIYGTRLTYRLAAGLGSTWDPNGVFPAMRCLAFNRATVVRPDLMLCFFRAGHLPGAATILLQDTATPSPQTFIYTGDCSLAATRFSEGLDLEALRHWQPDALLIEGTLGIERYPSRRHLENRLVERLATAVEEGSLVFLPVPALGLGQDLLYLLKTHHRFTQSKTRFTLWVDAAVGRGCDLYQELLTDFSQSIQNFAHYQPLFWEERVYPHVLPLPTTLCQLVEVVSGAGIVLCHAAAPPQVWHPLWQALSSALPQRNGNHLRWLQMPEVVLETPLTDWPAALLPHIQQESCGWHSHLDGSALLQIIHTLRPQHVILCHGDPDALLDLAHLPELSTRYHIHCSQPYLPLDLPPSQLQPSEPSHPPIRYEGHLDEWTQPTSSGQSQTTLIQILLPGSLTQDPRWQHWSDTGIVEATWQGEQLVIRGLSARELLKPVKDPEAIQTLRIPMDVVLPSPDLNSLPPFDPEWESGQS
ncbi:MAG: MBL fold metallo-hydrolase [Cyanobacteriota bacterium]|nr:MBL fold metallo-hydrolase [Cyanobacteriota bacterium]